jgi:KUP system potassium uptake protein
MKSSLKSVQDVIKSFGLVFGDIGTSPIYTLAIVFTLTTPDPENIIGILSLVFWTLVILVMIAYAWLAMSLSIKGEGGIIVLREILTGTLTSGRKIAFATFLGFMGVSLLFGDGVITPAISILSAVEGLTLFPGLENLESQWIILITCIISILLFAVQSKGTDKIAASFGPIMLIWFAALFITGLFYVVQQPFIIKALNPVYAINFFIENKISGFFVLSEVILCATGGEALYADMGHLGRKPIRRAWYFVFVALVVNYLGQGAYLIDHNSTGSVLFSMVHEESELFYIPFLILTIMATIIASQAMISAVMSLVYQGITTRIMPLMKVKYTSSHIKSQIYIGAVNWGLLIAVLAMILFFRKSGNLAAAYGFAVTATMIISAMFMILIFKKKNIKYKMYISIFVLIVDFFFLLAVFDKIPHGGYWSVIIAAIPFFIITLWRSGNRRMYNAFRVLPLDTFIYSYEQIYEAGAKIKGTALFFARRLSDVPPYVVHCMIRGNIIYEKNILVSINTGDYPYGLKMEEMKQLATGLYGLEINIGYMEILNLPEELKKNNIVEKVIFYGVEDIETKNFLFKIFTTIKKLSPSFVRFYKLPINKLHGVTTRLEI